MIFTNLTIQQLILDNRYKHNRLGRTVKKVIFLEREKLSPITNHIVIQF